MKSYLVYQLGYDSASDAEFIFTEGLFVVYDNRPEYIRGMADHHWGKNWFGLAYQSWDCNDLNVENKRIFREAAE
jgi:hypothetical protein